MRDHLRINFAQRTEKLNFVALSNTEDSSVFIQTSNSVNHENVKYLNFLLKGSK